MQLNNSLYNTMQFSTNKILPHLISLLAFFIVGFIYFHPVLNKKSLVQSDIVQVIGALQESKVYSELSSEPILWSNSGFAGMPVWRGFETDVFDLFHKSMLSILPLPILLTFLCYIGFYILLLTFKINPYLAIAGAFGYTFASFTFISIEAGHINKVFDMALIAPTLAGVVMIFNKKYYTGALTTLISAGLLIFYGHIQIIYYTLIVILFFALSRLYVGFKNKQIKETILSGIICLFIGLLAAIPNYSRLSVLSSMAPSTTRGGSELNKEKGTGLDKDYAFDWSYGKFETFTFIVPNLYGGSSHENIGVKSESFQTLLKAGVPRNQATEFVSSLPTYWGDQPFTSGPVYLGAVICFLFILGIIILNGPTRFWIISVTILALLLSWGKNLDWFNDFFFTYFPLYNKFRSVTMILAICQVTVALLGLIALNKVFNRTITDNELVQKLRMATIITGGLLISLFIIVPILLDFTSTGDSRLPEWLIDSIIKDRKSMFRKDVIRSLVFTLLAASVIWLYIKKKINNTVFFATFIGLILVDMFPVNKRYLDKSDFFEKEKYLEKVFTKSPIDIEILKDTASNYKVLNLSVNPFSDARTSYYHKSIGGYSAIKLSRYQDLIENHISKNNQPVIDMLNTKYIIYTDQKSNQLKVYRNPGALGNSWFVEKTKIVEGPREEIDALNNFDPSILAVVDKQFSNKIKAITPVESGDTIYMTNYHPNRISYQSISQKDKLAIFSEIYYSPGWQAYIDGNKVEHIRANYILRALNIPAGKHKVEFKFEPQDYYKAEKISLYGSILWGLITLTMLGLAVVKKEF